MIKIQKQLIVSDSYRTLTDTNKTSHANVVRASSEYTPACATAQSDQSLMFALWVPRGLCNWSYEQGIF